MPPIIEVRCTCGKKLRAKSKLAGKKVRCPNCQAQLSIPALSAEDAGATSPTPESELDGDTFHDQPTLPTGVLDVPDHTVEGEFDSVTDDVELTLEPLASAQVVEPTAAPSASRRKAQRASYGRVDLEYADDVLAQSWKIFTKNAVPILSAAFLLWFLPVLLAQALGSSISLTDLLFGGLSMFCLKIFIWLSLPAVVGFFAYPAMIFIVARTYLGSAPTLAETWVFLKPRLLKLIGTKALVFAIMVVAISFEISVIRVVGFLHANIVFLLLIIPNTFVSLCLVMTIPVVVCEGIAGIPAVKRSFVLMREHWMMLWAIYVFLGFVSIVVAGFVAGMMPIFLAPIAFVAIQCVMQAFITTVLVSLYFSSLASIGEFSVVSMRESLEVDRAG